MIGLSLRRLQTFAAVAECGSFRLAAELLHRSPSSVSAHVTQLEQELGVPLFNRTTRSVSLTDPGRALLSHCKSMLADLETTVRELREENQVSRGRVSIGSTPAMLGRRLPPILASYLRQYPGVRLTLKEGFAKDVYASLAAGETDFAVGPRISGLGDFTFSPIISNPFVVVIPRRLIPRPKRRMTLQEAMTLPQIALPIETWIRQSLESMFMRTGSAFTTSYEVRQIQSLLALVEAGLGVAIMPSLSVPPSKGGAYSIATLVDPSAHQLVGLVTTRGRRLSAPAQTCGEWIIRGLRKLGEQVQLDAPNARVEAFRRNIDSSMSSLVTK